MTAPPFQLQRFMDRHGFASYEDLIARADRDPEWFWPAVMDFHGLTFFKPFDKVLDTSKGVQWPEWCIGGTTNIAYNCMERTLARGHGGKAAIFWEGEDGENRVWSYSELAAEAERAAAGLKRLGLGKGDVVGIYMPFLPETIAAFLAITRIGAIALPMFSGFGPQAVIERLADAEAKAVVTVDVTYRRGNPIAMADIIDQVRPDLPALAHVVVVARHADRPQGNNRLWWHDLTKGEASCPAEPMPADAPCMIVYTSGTTGKPKGTVHSHCGFMTKVALDFGIILDLTPEDRLLWMSDMGWLTGPILAVAVPLIGASMVLAEGTPDFPDQGRLWRLAQDHDVTFLGVAPTMVRNFIQQPPEVIASFDFPKLRITASTGEPWTPEAWTWFLKHVCKGRAPILNYSGGTEIGGGIVSGTMLHQNLPPGAFAGPIPGMGAAVVDDAGKPLPRGQVGELALTIPSIGLTRGLWRSPERFIEAYWAKVPDMWIHGDFASVDLDGNWFVHGRSDDTIKIAGKRTGPSEVEALLLGTGKVGEAAVIGIPDPLKGSAVICVCVPARGVTGTPELADELKKAVVAGLGASFRPKAVTFVDAIPKTRSMKIMRRVVRSIWLGEPVGDLSGLVNPEAVDGLKAVVAKA
ncbi:AMP-dependent synthetase [Phreatobacter aquaticus]|uniref:acetate--CoA ligase n=1 Tax=Phreatobacter aquaticus TaxID=2570229 RepID=A0A4D7QGH6_9HYPH|nr:AMP-binding protein [Phreatobacter aquaticus]QCK86318.1 AMP-dependent synthetase [Phreatobacter aquaticus]